MNKPSRSLVVGATGQVGSRIVSLLGVENVTSTSRSGRSSDLSLDLGTLDERRAKEIVEHHRPRVVYCTGGMTDVEGCERNQELAMRVNRDGPLALAAACAGREVPFVYFSTEYVFNGNSGPYEEESTPDPISAYGASKWLGECAIQEAHPRALILRTTVVYGPDLGEKNFLYSLRRALLAGREFRVPEDQISTPTYNFDLAAATVRLASTGASGVFHVCGPELFSRLDFAREAARIMGLEDRRIRGARTSALGQIARRPLKAGLLTAKLRRFYPEVRMRTLAEGLEDWLGTHTLQEAM